MNYWYVAKADEIFIDLDGGNVTRLKVALCRLYALLEKRPAFFRDVFLFPSETEHHYHVVVRTTVEHPYTRRHALSLYLYSDVFRAVCNISRFIDGTPCPDLFISKLRFFTMGFRHADDKCNCERKHNNSQMRVCPAALRLRGDKRADEIFPKPITPPEGFFGKKFGKIWNNQK